VLTTYRLKHMEQRPLALPEFIGPLSLTANTLNDEYPEIKVHPAPLVLLEIH